jgi:hypothetical protein
MNEWIYVRRHITRPFRTYIATVAVMQWRRLFCTRIYIRESDCGSTVVCGITSIEQPVSVARQLLDLTNYWPITTENLCMFGCTVTPIKYSHMCLSYLYSLESLIFCALYRFMQRMHVSKITNCPPVSWYSHWGSPECEIDWECMFCHQGR